jgi:hypothetical protein
MNISNIPSDKLDQTFREIAYYQVYLGDDTIQGRDKKDIMHMTGSGELLEKLVQELKNLTSFLEKDQIKELLKEIEKRFQINFTDLEEDIERNYTAMIEYQMEEVSLLAMIFLRVMQKIRDIAYQKYGIERIIELYTKEKNKPFGKTEEGKLNQLRAVMDRSISLLENITYILKLAEIFGPDYRLTTLKRLATTKINIILTKL